MQNYDKSEIISMYNKMRGIKEHEIVGDVKTVVYHRSFFTNERNRKKWTRKDDIILQQAIKPYFSKYSSISEFDILIALKLGRTKGAVAMRRFQALNLKKKNIMSGLYVYSFFLFFLSFVHV